MRTLKYPSFVLRDLIHCEECDKYRYLLKIPFTKQPQNTALVILKNPSTATAHESDVTADRVINFSYKQGFDQVIIVNLFAYRSTNSDNLKLVAKENGILTIVGENNDQFIKSAVKEANKIIIAWGTPPSGIKEIYNRRIKATLKLLEDNKLFYVERISNNGTYPLHGQVWGYQMALKDFPE